MVTDTFLRCVSGVNHCNSAGQLPVTGRKRLSEVGEVEAESDLFGDRTLPVNVPGGGLHPPASGNDTT